MWHEFAGNSAWNCVLQKLCHDNLCWMTDKALLGGYKILTTLYFTVTVTTISIFTGLLFVETPCSCQWLAVLIDTYSCRVGARWQYVKQVHRRDEVKARERQPLGLEVLRQRLLTDRELFLNLLQTFIQSWSTGRLDHVLRQLNFGHDLLQTRHVTLLFTLSTMTIWVRRFPFGFPPTHRERTIEGKWQGDRPLWWGTARATVRVLKLRLGLGLSPSL